MSYKSNTKPAQLDIILPEAIMGAFLFINMEFDGVKFTSTGKKMKKYCVRLQKVQIFYNLNINYAFSYSIVIQPILLIAKLY